MINKFKIILAILTLSFLFLICACDDQSKAKKESTTSVISKNISRSVVQNKLQKDKKPENNRKKEIVKPENKKISVVKKGLQPAESKDEKKNSAHYDAKGKIDPFKPLLQEKTAKVVSVVDKSPQRILTPLEKIKLSQIRLVAVVILDNRRIAMVEESSGKGYEVRVGTYIGKNQGRVTEIKKNSIVIKERVKDYKGRLKERVQEIKLHKNES